MFGTIRAFSQLGDFQSTGTCFSDDLTCFTGDLGTPAKPLSENLFPNLYVTGIDVLPGTTVTVNDYNFPISGTTDEWDSYTFSNPAIIGTKDSSASF